MRDPNLASAKEISSQNLDAWQKSGVVKTLKYYSAADDAVCSECAKNSGVVVKLEDGIVGGTLPPLDKCQGIRCRCYFRPWDISLE
jgi:hypothetical protein